VPAHAEAVPVVPSFGRSGIHGVGNLSALSDGIRVRRTILYKRFIVPPRAAFPSIFRLRPDLTMSLAVHIGVLSPTRLPDSERI